MIVVPEDVVAILASWACILAIGEDSLSIMVREISVFEQKCDNPKMAAVGRNM